MAQVAENQSFHSESPLAGASMMLCIAAVLVVLLRFAAVAEAFPTLALIILATLIPLSLCFFFLCGTVTLSPEEIVFAPYWGDTQRMRWEDIERLRPLNDFYLKSRHEKLIIRFVMFPRKQAYLLKRALLLRLAQDFDVEDLLEYYRTETQPPLKIALKQMGITPRSAVNSFARILLMIPLLGLPVVGGLWLLIQWHQFTETFHLVDLLLLHVVLLGLPFLLALVSRSFRNDLRKFYRNFRRRTCWRQRKQIAHQFPRRPQ